MKDPSPAGGAWRALNTSDRLLLGGSAATILLSGILNYSGRASVAGFVVSALAVAGLAALVGRSVEQLGDLFGAGATGVLQSALGNLPELFVGFFALRAGLIQVVQAAIIGSILGNLLLVLGAAFFAGGLRAKELRFSAQAAQPMREAVRPRPSRTTSSTT